MTEKPLEKTRETGILDYRITMKGKLAENWKDLFNGILMDLNNDSEDGPLTVLQCRVQDQAELMGILNWVHNLNLKLLEVRTVEKETCDV